MMITIAMTVTTCTTKQLTSPTPENGSPGQTAKMEKVRANTRMAHRGRDAEAILAHQYLLQLQDVALLQHLALDRLLRPPRSLYLLKSFDVDC